MSNLILIGFKSAGKTTLGKCVAAKFQRPFIDTDALFDSPPSQLYEQLGPTAFRAQEKKLLFTLTSTTGSVISTGGGTPCDPESAQFLRKLGFVIHLQTSKEVIEKRLAILPPFLQHEPFDTLYFQRLSLYNEVAHHTITSEDEIWEVIHSDLFSASPLGENPMDLPLASSSTAVPQVFPLHPQT